MPTHPVQPPEWIDAAPVRNEASIEIAAPPAAVWAHVADHERWPEWFTALDKVEVTSGATGVGGGRRVTARRLSLDEEFTAWDENEHFAFAVVESKLPFLAALAESVRLAPTESGTRLVYCQGLQGKRGFGRLIGLVGAQMDKQLAPALANLKRRVETTN